LNFKQSGEHVLAEQSSHKQEEMTAFSHDTQPVNWPHQ